MLLLIQLRCESYWWKGLDRSWTLGLVAGPSENPPHQRLDPIPDYASDEVKEYL